MFISLLEPSQVTRNTGPAMTWSMHSINWLRLGQTSRAQQNFDRNFLYIEPDFQVKIAKFRQVKLVYFLRCVLLQVWSEVVGGGGTVNFLTGAGGFLQNVVFGYFGFELTASSLSFNPQLPQGVTALTAVNVDYLGNSFDFTFDENLTRVYI